MRVFLINLFSQSSKSTTFCEASATFQGSHQMLRLPRVLPLCHVCAALPMRFMKKTLWTRHKMLRLPRNSNMHEQQVLRLSRENDALALTRFQSIAPVTQNAKMSSHLATWKRENEHFMRDALQISHAEEIFQNTSGSWQRINDDTTTPGRRHDDPPTTPRRRHDDDTTNTTRTQVQPQTPTINGNPSLRIREQEQQNINGCFWFP